MSETVNNRVIATAVRDIPIEFEDDGTTMSIYKGDEIRGQIIGDFFYFGVRWIGDANNKRTVRLPVDRRLLSFKVFERNVLPITFTKLTEKMHRLSEAARGVGATMERINKQHENIRAAIKERHANTTEKQ